ncbi:PREDICTED: DUF4283 domain-containing [Prunus dulcis]|uniref:PREDICTED: DUF4283 domain-containing n=1 Tax=Prunus dulcis TaxID=3755 RepID=A0A5E4GDW5_PRUDU|nr:PREDICTED: DUF4283 domain-containing [Prunus dulcis]
MLRLNPPPSSMKTALPSPWQINETRVSTTALASSVQSHFESFYLVGKEEVSVDHIGRDWYKIKFCSEEDVDYVGQIFALQRWKPDFSPFHASVESIVCWVRIPFLPLHYKDPDVLSDLVSILETPISIDQASMVGKQSMFVRVCLENNEEKDVGWTVVSNGKGKAKSAVRDGRTFNEVARGIHIVDGVSSPIPKVYFKEAGPSGVDKGKNLMSDPGLSHE